VETAIENIKSVIFRAAMTRICSLEAFVCDASSDAILKNLGSLPIENFVEKNETFVVRIRRIGGDPTNLHCHELEKKIGEKILERTKKAKVNLTGPDKTFFGVLTGKKFVFGLKLAEISPKPFLDRTPRKKPFFHPSAMQPKLARCMVNLAQPKAGELVLDPFCGTASILIEAGLIQCKVMGFDVQRRMVKGSLSNLLRYGIHPQGMGVADAWNMPILKVDCVVTDPPYGRVSTTLGQDVQTVVRRFLAAIKDKIPVGKHICMASPKSIKIGRISASIGFKCNESHFVYVHRNLTREIVVLESVI
jgi:tRNA (guanine10-N2)-dimethyltransferase